MFVSDHNHSSLMHHWSDIQKYMNKFAPCMDDVERRRPSGMTERDKHAPKWNEWLTSKKKNMQSNAESCCPDDEDDKGNPSDSTLKRPCGRKAAKRAKSNHGQDNSVELTDVVEVMWTKKNESDS